MPGITRRPERLIYMTGVVPAVGWTALFGGA